MGKCASESEKKVRNHNLWVINSSAPLSQRFCGGLILDVKRKLPFFASDFYDALHIQSLSTILFIYLGTVTNAITFGGLLGDATDSMQVNPPALVMSPDQNLSSI